MIKSTISYKTSTHKSQTKLNLVPSRLEPLSTPERPSLSQEHVFHKELDVPSEDFIAHLIESGETPSEALRIWEIALKNRQRRKA